MTVSLPSEGASKPQVSVVFPVMNEEGCLEALYREVSDVLEHTGITFELVFIDNGSTDSSLAIMKRLHQGDTRVHYLSLSRNFGHQGALIAGLHDSRGAAVITMDADLQHPPALLPEMIRLWREGYEVVFTTKKASGLSGLRRRQIQLFYWLISKWSGLKLSFGQSDFRLMDRKVVDVFRELPEYRKFLRGLVEWVGFRQIGLEYEVAPRRAGESKFPLGALVSFAIDGIMAFSLVPLRWSLGLGVAVAALCFLFGVVTVGLGILNLAGVAVVWPPGWATLSASILFLASIQLIAIGVLSEYVGRIFEETKHRPQFIVRETSRPDGRA